MNTINKQFTIFLVEDDVWYAEILQYHLSMNPDYVIERFETGEQCISNLHKHPHLICMDYSLPDMTGQELIKRVKRTHAHIPIVMISGQKEIQVALDLLKEENVYDYLVKDDDAKDRLWNTIIKIRENNQLKAEVEHLKDELGRKYDFSEAIKGNSSAIKKTFKMMQKACDHNITVSITGETGTGKELVAKCIHYNSKRSKKPYVTVNMTAIPSELMESELFGHEKGAFTGAHARRVGKFEEAQKGSIFLDEIADMDPSMQAKLLRVLQEREVTRVGSNKAIEIDVRIIVATHKNLAEEVKKGNFREDLYFRLLGLPIELPPLRERKDDILILAKHFCDAFCQANKKPKLTFSAEAKNKLSRYNFPGNIRELKSVVELAAVMVEGDTIQADDITIHSTGSFKDFLDEQNTLKGYIADIITHHLEKYDNDVALVANKLDIGKSTLYKMIKRGDIKV